MRELQEWMYDAITSPEFPADTSRLVDADRLEIYRGMYPIRVYDAMAVDYPATHEFLGEDAFRELVLRYVADYPSRSYTLNRLGDKFPEFLKDDDPFLRDLARLELAMTEVFDEEETPALADDAIAAIGPDSRLRFIAAFRLAAFDYPVKDFFLAFRNDDELVRPEPRKTWVAFHRRDYAVHRMELEERAYEFLSALRDGATILEAIDGTSATQDELFAWFRDWSAAGIFGGIE